MNRFLKILAALSLVSALSGCGDTSNWLLTNQSTTQSDSYAFPAGKSVITFSAYSSATLAVPISAIDLSVTLPPGMSLATAGGVSGPIDNASVTPGSALSGTNLAFGTYSVSTRKVRLSMTTTSGNYRSGEFLRLICDVAATPALTLGDLRALNNPVPVVKVVGYNPATQSTVVLTGNVKAVIGVTQ
jgi:hypothetical protein